jgi:hypothetical protein
MVYTEISFIIIATKLGLLNKNVYTSLTLFILDKDCDMILGAISQSIGIGRLDYLEIPHSWLHARIAFLIPMPEVLQNNVDAVIKPFQGWVYRPIFFIHPLNHMIKYNIQLKSQMSPIV